MKLSLKGLKVKSFVTSLEVNKEETAKGGLLRDDATWVSQKLQCRYTFGCDCTFFDC